MFRAEIFQTNFFTNGENSDTMKTHVLTGSLDEIRQELEALFDDIWDNMSYNKEVITWSCIGEDLYSNDTWDEFYELYLFKIDNVQPRVLIPRPCCEGQAFKWNEEELC